MSPRNVLLILLTAGIGVFAFLISSGALLEPEPAPVEESVVREHVTSREGVDVGSAPSAESLEGPGGAAEDRATGTGGTTVIYPLEVDFGLALSGEIPQVEGALPIRSGANAGIRGQIRGPDGVPAQATVTFAYGPNEGRVLTTDSEGRFGAADLWQGASIVRVLTSAGLKAEREVRLAQLNTTEFSLSFANPSRVAGTITDEAGRAIEGAEINLDGWLLYSDVAGKFVKSGIPAGKLLVTVRKPGFAIERRSVSIGLSSKILADQFKIQLSEAATLELVAGARAGAPESSWVMLMPAAGPSVDLGERDFPWYELNPIELPPGGRVTLEGLPDESVNVRVFHRGATGRPRSQNVRLYAGRKVAAVVDLAPAPTLTGRVLDGDKPVSGARVVFEAADRSIATSKSLEQRSPRFAMDFIAPTVPTSYDTMTTDSSGRFRFTTSPDVITTYWVTATSADGKKRGIGVIPPGADGATIMLEEIRDTTGEVEIDLPGRFQGLPVEVRVEGTPRDPIVLRPGDDLVIDGLPRGAWRVRAMWRGEEVVRRKLVDVGDGRARVEGRLPEGAIKGQTAEERQRAGMR